ncbi:MAG: NAD(P)/FAD-dependent oxidoreductase, partial [Granulosicoccus sp.]
LLPDVTLQDSLQDAKRLQPKSLARTVIAQLLPKNVVQEFEKLWWPSYQDRPLADWPDAQIERVGKSFNRWEIVPAGTEGYRTAEVTLGGVDTNDLSSRTMQANKQQGLYFIGEVVDVTGHLGGFNFQWAWSSAYACAQSLARRS